MFKIGDRVKIKSLDRLASEDPYFRDRQPYFVSDMNEFTGRFAKVAMMPVDNTVQLDIDKCEYKWHLEWLEPANKISIPDELFEL